MLLNNFEATIKKYSLLKPGEKVVVAVSGGPDSVALLYLLHSIRKKARLSLHIAHLNHGLRAKESDLDSNFVEALAEKLHLPVSIDTVDTRSFARQKKISIEEAARDLRYAFFTSVALSSGSSKIALGHTRDDQAETVMMRLLRGSGLSGLRAIPVSRDHQGITIIRPLIESTRKEITGFLRKKGQSFRIDSSNQSDRFLRNKVRNYLLPAIEEKFNANIKEVLCNLAENINDDYDFLEGAAEDAFNKACSRSRPSEIILRLRKVRDLHNALQKMVLRKALRQLKGNTNKIDYRHWKEIDELIRQRPNNSIVDLPHQISVIKKGSTIRFYRKSSNHA